MYLERTLQVKAALLERPDLLEKMRSVFASHIAKDNKHEPIGRGKSRWAYEIGECEVSPGIKLSLILKLYKESNWLKYSRAAKRSQFSEWSEFGAFEMYYDFVAGHINTVSFKSKAGYVRYVTTSFIGKEVKSTFSFAENWGGTEVAQGDTGAIPYFQLAIRNQDWFGQLTEGEPPFIKPKYTAKDHGTMDDYTIKNGRIIDIDPKQCLLIDIDRGGSRSINERYSNNLGLNLRGEKYFRPANRLDI